MHQEVIVGRKILDRKEFMCYNYQDVEFPHQNKSQGEQTMNKLVNEERNRSFSADLDMLSLTNLSLNEVELSNFYRNAEERIFYITYEIERDNLVEISKFILRCNKEDEGIPREERKPIRLYIYSYGGELDACIYFFNICRLSITPIWTYNLAIAMSGGLILLLAGEKRYALKDSVALIHQGAQEGGGGTFEQVQANAENYKKRISIAENWILERTKIPKSLYARKKKNEWYLQDTEQIEYGIVDEIITDIGVLL